MITTEQFTKIVTVSDEEADKIESVYLNTDNIEAEKEVYLGSDSRQLDDVNIKHQLFIRDI